LAVLAPGAQHVIATKSGHDIPSTEPDLVITAVRQVVDAVRVLRGANPSEVEQPTRFEMRTYLLHMSQENADILREFSDLTASPFFA
jgi:hypothetical protein